MDVQVAGFAPKALSWRCKSPSSDSRLGHGAASRRLGPPDQELLGRAVHAEAAGLPLADGHGPSCPAGGLGGLQHRHLPERSEPGQYGQHGVSLLGSLPTLNPKLPLHPVQPQRVSQPGEAFQRGLASAGVRVSVAGAPERQPKFVYGATLLNYRKQSGARCYAVKKVTIFRGKATIRPESV